MHLVHLFLWNPNEPTRHSQAAERLLSVIKFIPVPVLFSFPALNARGEHSLSSAWHHRATVRCCPFNDRTHRCTFVVRCYRGTGQ